MRSYKTRYKTNNQKSIVLEFLKSLFLLCSFTLAFNVSGCATTTRPQINDPQITSQLVPGTTTIEQVKKLLGEPDKVALVNSSEIQYLYSNNTKPSSQVTRGVGTSVLSILGSIGGSVLGAGGGAIGAQIGGAVGGTIGGNVGQLAENTNNADIGALLLRFKDGLLLEYSRIK